MPLCRKCVAPREQGESSWRQAGPWAAAPSPARLSLFYALAAIGLLTHIAALLLWPFCLCWSLLGDRGWRRTLRELVPGGPAGRPRPQPRAPPRPVLRAARGQRGAAELCAYLGPAAAALATR